MKSLSLIIPTYGRGRVLIETLESLLPLLGPGDEILVVDQTADHLSETLAALKRFSLSFHVHWIRRSEPGICRAMNCGALMARNELILFLDDDVIPSPLLLEEHREALSHPGVLVTAGQILQPWDAGSTDSVQDFDANFHFAYSRECDILNLMGGNFGVRRQAFLDLGGLDENFSGVAYRWEAEFISRFHRCTGCKVRFLPRASLRHLRVPAGGTRSHGDKDTWKHISGSVGDYYYAMKCLPFSRAARHCLRRLFRAPLNRATIRRPWVIPSLFGREIVAWSRALTILPRRNRNYLKPLADYAMFEAPPTGKIGEHV